MPKILYIDDDKRSQVILASLLENLIPDCDILTVSSGKEGIKIAKEESLDTILLDIVMPEMDGFEVCKKLKSNKNTKHIPVILITALRTDSSSRIKGLEIGADAFISKPVDKGELVAQVKAMLRIKGIEDQMRSEKKNLQNLVQESEQLFKTLFDHVFDAIVVIDDKSKIINVNVATCKLLGYFKKELLQLTVKNIHPDEEMKKIRDAIKRVLKKGIDYMGETLFLTKKQESIPVEAGAVSFQAGGKTFILASFRDIREHKRAEKELRESYEKLKNSLGRTVNALASTLEMRDPYTVGHQRRVAKLACEIAKEMELSQNQIEGIRIAGLLHDIGKISIPSEILNKPGRLNKDEFNFIKSHPQTAFDVLKDIEFPWPVAKIVLQHHEKMNGSGYPQGLLAKDILIESRILTVSDVVEAMLSHRPYRPALDLKKVLDEITTNKGKLFDSNVVEICLKLLVKGKFDFD